MAMQEPKNNSHRKRLAAMELALRQALTKRGGTTWKDPRLRSSLRIGILNLAPGNGCMKKAPPAEANEAKFKRAWSLSAGECRAALPHRLGSAAGGRDWIADLQLIPRHGDGAF